MQVYYYICISLFILFALCVTKFESADFSPTYSPKGLYNVCGALTHFVAATEKNLRAVDPGT